jgi:hypothetical protein
MGENKRNFTVLLEKLITIEKSIGMDTPIAVRQLLIDAQDCVLQLHGELVRHGKLVQAVQAPKGFALLRGITGRF